MTSIEVENLNGVFTPPEYHRFQESTTTPAIQMEEYIMKLLKIKLQNFQGVKDAEFDFVGKSASI